MIKINFTDGDQHNVSADFPEGWDEMTTTQVQYVFRQYERLASGAISLRRMQVLVVLNILGIRKISPGTARHQAVTENITRLCELTAFLFAKENGRAPDIPALSFQSVQNPLPSIIVGKRHLTGPGTLCQDLTFGEFRNAAMALNVFFKTEDPEALDECVAHLYRPRSIRANKAGRFVRPVRAESFGAEVEAMKAVPSWKKNIVMLWFASCIHYLQNETITLNGEEVHLRLLFADNTDSGGLQATWNDLLVQIAREGTVGTMDAVDEAPLMMVIAHMWSNYKENKRNEKNLKKAQKAQRLPA